MRAVDNHLFFSATDLSSFLGCSHLTLLDRAVQLEGLGKPPKFDDPALEVLQKRGEEHERAYLERLREEGRNVVEVPEPPRNSPYREQWDRHAATTLKALRTGADVVYQAALFDGTWLGRADFLVKVDRPSDLGAWSYEVVDTKLAREAKAGALLQVLLYADLLAQVQGRMPEYVRLALAGPNARDETFRVADYAAYFRAVRERFLRHVDGAAGAALPVAPDPVAQCDVCAWRLRCERERREADHLSLVASISGRQREALRGRGVDTLTELAGLGLPVRPRLDGVSDAALERVREQARIQAEGRRRGAVIHELLEPVVPDQGLAALPEPSDGDLFFDLESDPFAFTHGIEYLFGWTDRTGEYSSLWALNREQEKAAFERFIDMLMERLKRWPDLHVYHFAAYEPSALKRLMGLHGTREEEVDRLLRGRVLVDLYRVVRQGLRASVESYSIKKLEPLYGFRREVDLRQAGDALAVFSAWLELGASGHDGAGEELLGRIEGYNQDDCVSTLRLRDWLEAQRLDLHRRTGVAVPRPDPSDAEPGENVAEEEEEVARLVVPLTEGVPADEDLRTPEEHARWLLAQTLSFHRREDKSTWWEYFRCLDLSADEAVEDGATLGGLEYEGVVRQVKRSLVHRYRFPAQDHGIEEGSSPRDPETQGGVGTVVRVDDAERVIELRRGATNDAPQPTTLVPLDHVDNRVLRQSLRCLGAVVAEEGLGDRSSRRSASDLLTRRPPRCGQEPGAVLADDDEDPLDAACRLVERLDRSVLAIQGPPGSGKTYTGARMILRLLAAGKRVGVTATSHKVITNLLNKVCEAADEAGVGFNGVQKSRDGDGCADPRIAQAGSNGDLFAGLATGAATLAAGTAWLWSGEAAEGALDVLFIDEAGQFSLANALAVSQSADSLVLLGDPAQLDQPQKGTHPPGSEASALAHLLGGAVTMPAQMGLFLARTWRLHPCICDFTSEIYYGNRLRPKTDLERQLLSGGDAIAGAGLRLLPVPHAGNQNESPEEVEAVAELVQQLLTGDRTWTDRNGASQALGLDDILVVAPYNAQLAAIAKRLPDGARVGTVDKFQGQEAPVVIYSMASSTPEDAPRGMAFLYSPNRFNVATSRAQCLAIVVASPPLFAPACHSPAQIKLANGFCRFRELAEDL